MTNLLAQMSDGVSISISAGTAAVVTAAVVKWLTRKNGNGNGISKAIENHQDRCIDLVIGPRLDAIDEKLEILTRQKDGKA